MINDILAYLRAEECTTNGQEKAILEAIMGALVEEIKGSKQVVEVEV
jgi:hypothetical protein